MAQTLASGVVIPDPGDRISAAGVQEMRTLGASVDSGLSLAQAQVAQVDAQSRARDADLADQVAGMEGMTYVGAWESGTSYRINDVVTHGGDSWARLTAGDAGEPGTSPTDWGLVARKGDGGGFGQLTETEVVGLYDTVEPPPWSPPDPIDLGTAHLDTITEPGDYTQIFASRATKANGYPHDGEAGILSIRTWNVGNAYVIATFTPWRRAAMAKRTLYSTGWQEWFGVDGNTIR